MFVDIFVDKRDLTSQTALNGAISNKLPIRCAEKSSLKINDLENHGFSRKDFN
jgi:hypothetical protein